MTSLKDAIEEVWKTYASTLGAGDMDGWISLWIDDGIQMPPDVPRNIGKEKIREYNQKTLDQFQFKISINNEEVRETNDWGFARGLYSFELIPKGEGETIKGSGKFLTVLEKQDDGSWKIARDIFNFNAPLQ
ncbi:MAG: YybH family protein [Candidatus Hodarchaeota archaeon]